ncbi:sphingomyelin phosphodiesterase, putative [Plasmodium chabaudi chabaudi]|uniref:Sphingomyelin phosphodiesterase, putative n=1 Tax=Plasmodium chabaudi chabaudi TaxID=31271 RepID=A0A4V6M9Y3_PLACU|nr:sphingomyelin phosphodiesterase, putative [Plasmodium chabaudi chabaudi]VTZ71230.1 sphingomyelin phosphodiesterase, putative [Plasmodium chabaudi chabaudi]|eukprot:XP_745097.2 sphingomyelin phosphodiesterase, putative [Plasmodium chabaudi chabaudi]
MALATSPDQHFTIMSYNVQMIHVPLSRKINVGHRQKTLGKYICELDDIYNIDVLALNEVFTKQAYEMLTTGEIKKRFPYHTKILGDKTKSKLLDEDDNDDEEDYDDDEYYNNDLFSKNIERDIKEYVSNDCCNDNIYNENEENGQECGCDDTESQNIKNEIQNKKNCINSNGKLCNGTETNVNNSLRGVNGNNITPSDSSIKNNINSINKLNNVNATKKEKDEMNRKIASTDNKNCESCEEENNETNGDNMVFSPSPLLNNAKDAIKKKKKDEKKYEDPPPFDSISGGPKFRHFLNGGIIVLSKHKITHKHALIFENCKFPEMFSAKGAIYIKTNIENRSVNIVTTHLHAGNSKGDEKCRRKQIDELSKWVYQGPPSEFIKKGEPLFFVGDFNIRYIKDDDFFKEITSSKYLNCTVTNNTLETTYDSSINDYCEYAEDDFDHKYVDTLDYILVSKDSNVTTVIPQTAVQRGYKPISIFRTILCCIPYQSINIHHASDHFPIYATFKLPDED